MSSLKRTFSVSEDRIPSKKRTKTEKKSYSSSKSTVKSAIEKYFRKHVELKESNTFFSSFSPTTGGQALQIMTNIASGTDIGSRIGRHIRVKQIRCRLSLQEVATTTGDNGMWYLVYDRQPNVSIPSISDILDLSTGTTAGLAFKNTAQNGSRFKLCVAQPWQVNSNGERFTQYEFFYKVPDAEQDIEFQGSAANVGLSGNYFIVIGANYNTTTNVVAIGNAKVQFTDV